MAYVDPITGFQTGILQNGQYSPRLDQLQQDYSSGKYSSSTDLAAAQREIQNVFAGRSGSDITSFDVLQQQIQTAGFNPSVPIVAPSSDKPKVADCDTWDLGCKYNKLLDNAKEKIDSVMKTGGDILDVAKATTGNSSSCSICDSFSAWFKKSAVKMSVVVVGILLIFGAFLTYRR